MQILVFWKSKSFLFGTVILEIWEIKFMRKCQTMSKVYARFIQIIHTCIYYCTTELKV